MSEHRSSCSDSEQMLESANYSVLQERPCQNTIRAEGQAANHTLAKSTQTAVSGWLSLESLKDIQPPRERGPQWTPEEESQLVALHNQKGNRWVEIGRELNRTDNSVKNHYHSRLRKALRKINTAITDLFSRTHRPFKPSILSRVVQTAEDCYHGQSGSAQAKLALELKNLIISYGIETTELDTSNLADIEEMRSLVCRLSDFNKSFQNGAIQKGKKDRNGQSSGNRPNRYKGKEIKGLISQNLNKQEQNDRNALENGSSSPQSIALEIAQQAKSVPCSESKKAVPKSSNQNAQLPLIGPSPFARSWGDFYYCNPFMGVPFYPFLDAYRPALFSGKTSSFSSYGSASSVPSPNKSNLS